MSGKVAQPKLIKAAVKEAVAPVLIEFGWQLRQMDAQLARMQEQLDEIRARDADFPRAVTEAEAIVRAAWDGIATAVIQKAAGDPA